VFVSGIAIVIIPAEPVDSADQSSTFWLLLVPANVLPVTRVAVPIDAPVTVLMFPKLLTPR
jgi:hypothetical protein